MASPPDPQKGGPPATTANLAELSPQEFRDWVQSQIANKMLIRLSAVGFGLIALMAGGFIASFDWALRNSQTTIQKNVVDEVSKEVQTNIKAEVLTQILDRSALMEHAQNEIQTAAGQAIIDSLQSEDFKNKTFKLLVENLGKSGGPEIVLHTASERAVDRGESDSSRALALRLFTLFHPGESTSGTVESVRKMFLTILDNESPGQFPPKLLEAVIEHYPLGEYGTGESNSECGQLQEKCRTSDITVVKAILDVLEAVQRYPVDKILFDDFFRRIPPEASTDVLNWVKKHSVGGIGRHIVQAIMHSGRDELVAEVMPDITDFAADRDNSRLRQIGLEALATVDPHMPMHRGARVAALTSVWHSASEEELYEAFPSTLISSLVSTANDWKPVPAGGQPFEDWVRQFYTDSVREESLVAFLRLSIVALLRTGENGGTEYTVNNPQGVNDWDFVLKSIEFGRRPI